MPKPFLKLIWNIYRARLEAGVAADAFSGFYITSFPVYLHGKAASFPLYITNLAEGKKLDPVVLQDLLLLGRGHACGTLHIGENLFEFNYLAAEEWFSFN